MNKQKTVQDFIDILNSLPESRKELPLYILCPNKEDMVFPCIKMGWNDVSEMLRKQVDYMVIDWNNHNIH